VVPSVLWGWHVCVLGRSLEPALSRACGMALQVDGPEKKAAEDKFREVAESYEVLSDEEKRTRWVAGHCLHSDDTSSA
jgi:hypothetical protein